MENSELVGPDATQQPAAVTPLAPTEHNDQLYQRVLTYPFHTDTDYLLGLAAILGHPESPPTDSELRENEDLVQQAQCFYLARKFNLPEINVEEYRRWLGSPQAQLQFASISAPTPTLANTTTSDPVRELAAITNGAANPSQLINLSSSSGNNEDKSTISNVRSPIPNRPHAPTPSTAAAATTLDVRPNQQLSSALADPNPTSSTDNEPSPPYPTSFAEIVDLITQNKPIPGIETIPDTVLEPGSSKVDKATRRKKPWEQEPPDPDSTLDAASIGAQAQGNVQGIDVESHKQTGQGVVKILQPGAIPDSGLIARE